MAPRKPISALDDLLREKRTFSPPASFRKQALVRDDFLARKARRNPEKFWASIASELHWEKRWTKVLDWKIPYAKWFVGGKINVSVNCLDRHLDGPRRNKAALIWEGEPGERRTYTYKDLHREVCQFANALKKLGVHLGDRVAIYLPLIPELPIAMLACARIGAPHSVVFGGFSSQALVDRIHDSQATAVITQDGSFRRGTEVKLCPAGSRRRR